MEEKKLILIDAFAIIFRSYFAFGSNQRYNSKGLNTSVTLGFTNTLLDVINKQKPTHVAVVFDAPGPSFRNEMFPEYKAHRDETPEDIKSAIPYVKKLCDGFRIPMLEKVGYEADDIIGTIAKKAEKEGFNTLMITPDKDFAQLVTDKIKMYRPGRSGKPAEIWGIPEVQAKFEVERPEQVIDILGLWGDSADNIPGIPGIGEKTSKKLVGQYGSVEGLIENVEDLKGKQKENVINFAEQGLLSKKLATIAIDAPVEIDFKAMAYDGWNKELLLDLFTELEFRTLSQRILGAEIKSNTNVQAVQATTSTGQMDLFATADVIEVKEDAPVEGEIQTFETVKPNYQLIQGVDQVNSFIGKLSALQSFCFDTETTGLDSHTADVIGMSFSWKKNEAYYVPVELGKEMEVLTPFKAVFENPSIEKVGQNIKYDINVLRNYGIKLKGKLFDTMIAHYLLEPDSKHNMDFLSETYLNYRPISIETLIGKKGKNQQNMKDVPVDQVLNYAAEDADITWQLKEVFEPKLEERKVKVLFDEIEMPLVSVLAEMEANGIGLDTKALADFSIELEQEIDQLEKRIIEKAGMEFNISSPKQLGEVLFDHLQIDAKAKKTKTGQYKTDEETLQKLAGKHPVIEDILTYRQLKKLKSTYVDALTELVSPKTNKIHTHYSQAVAATGRLASNNPNLQNIPIKTEKGREVRKAFIPSEGCELYAADYSQVELRLMAEMSQDKNMVEAFQKGLDIHAATAAKVYGVELEEVTREMRNKAKMVNFGIIYGISAFGLSQRLNVSRGEAKELIDNYFATYPGVKHFMDASVDGAKEHGYVQTIMKRKRFLKDINSSNAVVRGYAERNAINAPIQGSAADIIKIAMINIQNEIEAQNLQSKMLLQVHDELVFDVVESEKEILPNMVKEKMETAVKTSVPLLVEGNFGTNWLEAH